MRRSNQWSAATVVILMSSFGSSASAQCANLVEVWVDPDQGEDIPPPPPSNPPIHVPIQIDNPLAPTKTIQFAIDLASGYLAANYNAQSNPDQEAVIHLMPGIYGSLAVGGNGETLPVSMKDRVHVRGVSARHCVIRGDGSQTVSVYWPSQASCQSGSPPGFRQREVLVSYTNSGRFSYDAGFQTPPWACNTEVGETTELLDAVTLQGGEIQVYFGFQTEFPVPLAGRISN